VYVVQDDLSLDPTQWSPEKPGAPHRSFLLVYRDPSGHKVPSPEQGKHLIHCLPHDPYQTMRFAALAIPLWRIQILRLVIDTMDWYAHDLAPLGRMELQSQVHLLIDEFIEQHLPSFSLRVEGELAPAAFNLLRTATKKLKGEGRMAAYKALGRAEEAFYERIKVADLAGLKKARGFLQREHGLAEPKPAPVRTYGVLLQDEGPGAERLLPGPAENTTSSAAALAALTALMQQRQL